MINFVSEIREPEHNDSKDVDVPLGKVNEISQKLRSNDFEVLQGSRVYLTDKQHAMANKGYWVAGHHSDLRR